MGPLYSLPDHVCGLATQAVKTRAHILFSSVISFGGSKTTGVPAKFFVSYPSLLTSGGSNPHSGSSTGMKNRKAPFGFQIQNVGVRNQFRSQRINNLNLVIAQDKFWFNPNQICKEHQKSTEQQFGKCLAHVGVHREAVNGKKNNQHKGRTCPGEIASGSKGFIHRPSIAGERK